MSALNTLQTRLRREGKPAFTLMELIVVVLVFGVLAAIAVPTFQRVKENSAVRVVQSTLETLDGDGEAIAVSDSGLSDDQVAQSVISETDPRAGMTLTRDGAEITVEYTNGPVTVEGSVTFSDGIGTIVSATVSGGGGGAYYVSYTTGSAYAIGVYDIPLNTILYNETANTLAMAVPSNITTAFCGTWPASVTFLHVRVDNDSSSFTWVSNPSTVNNGDGTSTITFDLDTAQVSDGRGNVSTQALTNVHAYIYQVESLSCNWSTRFGF